MAITGIASLIYGVDDVAVCQRFFEDFGLPLVEQNEGLARFVLAEGSQVVIRHRDDRALKPSVMEGIGVREVIWAVDTEESFANLVAGLAIDHELSRDADGTVHFTPDFGIPMGLRVFAKRPVVYAPEPANAPGQIKRLNQHRKWRERARPKVISHVVWAIPDYDAGFAFMRDRLGFRLSDYQRGFGKYLRADGTNNHHNILLLNANAHLPDMDGKVRFHHANFGVEDLDEIMLGANHMTRKGWQGSELGLGRHRVDSALFYYIPCPAGGEVEYGADSDYVDDNWVPRDWVNPLFGYAHFVHNIPPFLEQPPAWDVRYMTSEAPYSTEETN